MRRTRSFTFVLIAILGVAFVATGYGVAQLTSVETEVRVVARPHEDGRVEFAVQQRVDGEWGERRGRRVGRADCAIVAVSHAGTDRITCRAMVE